MEVHFRSVSVFVLIHSVMNVAINQAAEHCYMLKGVGNISEGSLVWIHDVIPLSVKSSLCLYGDESLANTGI